MNECENNNLANNLSWEFDLNNTNTARMTIINELLDTKERAEERAMSGFLKNAFAQNTISFRTSITSLVLNQVIRVEGLNYIIKSISPMINDRSMIVSIQAVRYD